MSYQRFVDLAKEHWDYLTKDGLIFVAKRVKGNNEYYWLEKDQLTNERILSFEDIVGPSARGAFLEVINGAFDNAYDKHADGIDE